MSTIKVGLLVAWPAFWTGVPFKVVLVLLLLAMGLHPWEMPGLAFLLLLSIPIDIWALNLAAKTVFLERLRLRPPDSVGLTLWWQAALMSALYVPALYVIESYTVNGAKAVTKALLDMFPGLPVAERIAIELTLWGSVATVVLLLLVLGWLFLFGWIVKARLAAAMPAEGPYPALIRQWDLMRVPADQPLLLTAFTACGVVLVFLLWAFMPVTTPHPHEDYKKMEAGKVQPAFKPTEALKKSEKVIAQAESAIEALEAKAETEPKDKGRKAPIKDGAQPKPVPTKPAKKDSVTDKADLQAADGRKH